MALECSCIRLLSVAGKPYQWWSLPRHVFYSLHISHQVTSPTMHYYWPSKTNSLLRCHNLLPRPLLSSFNPHIYLGKMGLKYQSNHKRNFVKEVKSQEIAKSLKGHSMMKGVHGVIQDKRLKLNQTEERWKRNSKRILADIKETKSKMKEKMEEIIERENVWTVPNLLCVSRIAAAPYLGYLILEQDFHWALGLLTVAAITDMLDGWIARNFKNQSSKLGSFLDPMADKVLIATMFLSLTYTGIIPVPLTGLIITRDVLLVGAGFVIRYQSLPPPRTLSRYFDVTHATAQLAPTFISKVNTMVQLLTVACTLAAPVFDYLEHPALYALWCTTAGTTVASAASYLLTKNTFKFLKKT
uniref:cardiolipin synthase (CMP-forming) n=1 Tax=Graphocephala atropunctata TaxID=36148 RepID=A0A1B6LKR0_9HEMI